MGAYRTYARIVKATRLATALAFAKRHGIGAASAPVYLDIGARGGLPPAWAMAARFGIIRPVFVEADEKEAERLSKRYRSAIVIPHAVGARSEARNLYLTADRALSSLLVPDVAAYLDFDVAPWKIEVVENVKVCRLDKIWTQYETNSPLYLKIDVQGFEKEVIVGMGDLIDQVICIEFESTFLPMYEKQPRFEEMFDLLKNRGFGLVRMNPHGLGLGGITEFNALMVRRHHQKHNEVTFWKIMNDVGDHERVVTFGY